MEYIACITDSLKTVDEHEIEYIDAFSRPDIFFGVPFFGGDYFSFSKFSFKTRCELMSTMGDNVRKEFLALEKAASGCRIRLRTNSNKIIFKIDLKRKWDYQRMNLWNSSGFDVYSVDQHKYTHKTIFAPESGKKLFAESIRNTEGDLCIFLPLYNEILSMYIGIKKGSYLESVPYEKKLPILFYGNSITQGAAASRSGNCFCNMVSRNLDCDIINFSISSCCKGLLSVAETIGKLNCTAIVIDYTRNAFSVSELEKTYEKFYREIRSYHANVPIILMTTANFNNWTAYYEYDIVVKNTYEKALNMGEQVYLLDQKAAFKNYDYDLIAIDGMHYTDLGMKIISDEICNILAKL